MCVYIHKRNTITALCLEAKVATLDKFEAHIVHLKEMIDLRQKQYEYHREKLLSF